MTEVQFALLAGVCLGGLALGGLCVFLFVFSLTNTQIGDWLKERRAALLVGVIIGLITNLATKGYVVSEGEKIRARRDAHERATEPTPAVATPPASGK